MSDPWVGIHYRNKTAEMSRDIDSRDREIAKLKLENARLRKRLAILEKPYP